MLNFQKVHSYFNDYIQSLKNELLANKKLTTPAPIDYITLRYNGGDIDDYTLSDNTFTITNDEIVTADCLVLKEGVILTEDTDYTVSGNDITILDTTLTDFDIKLYNNVGNYLQGLAVDNYGNSNYTTNGVVENLGVQLLDTRVLNYIQTVSIGITSKAEYRNAIMLMCEQLCEELQDQIVEITDTDTYSLHIRCTQAPNYTQNYKAHGIEEFNTSILFDIKITTAPDYANEEELYIDDVLIPYSDLETSKGVETHQDTSKDYSYARATAKRNIGVIKVTGYSYTNNAVLQALKNEVRDLDEFSTSHTVVLQKGTILNGTITDRTITVTDATN